MHVLIVEDEVGIREGLASFLQLKGIRVRTADSVTAARAVMEREAFDLIVSDWRLGSENAAAIVALAQCPCVVVSGYPDEVLDEPRIVRVLPKPIPPRTLLAEIERLRDCGSVATPEPARSGAKTGPTAALPVDTGDRVRLALGLLGDPEAARIVDDGAFVTVSGAPRDVDAALPWLEAIGGDLRVLERDGAPYVELRLFRDGRPDGIAATVRPGEPWPAEPTPVAVDLDGAAPIGPAEFLELVAATDRARVAGREIWLLNVPAHLRFFVEALGRGDQLPKRPLSGPRLPEVLTELWR